MEERVRKVHRNVHEGRGENVGEDTSRRTATFCRGQTGATSYSVSTIAILKHPSAIAVTFVAYFVSWPIVNDAFGPSLPH